MNQIKSQLHTLLDKKMDRQDFLKHVAVGLVAISGVGAVLRLFSVEKKPAAGELSYGGSAYGGVPQNKSQG